LTIERKEIMVDVGIIGGGIAGLTAAALLSKAGKTVSVFERSGHVGGRAQTQTVDGFHFNLGPHALYRGGHASRTLSELGISIQEDRVGSSGSYAISGGALHVLPAGPVSMMVTDLFSLRSRLEALGFLARLPRINPRPFIGATVSQWLQTAIEREDVRNFVRALVRVSSYCDAPDEMSAGAAIEQLQLVFQNGVAYLNGGWQTLVDRIQQVAERSGCTINTGSSVLHVEFNSGGDLGIRLSDGNLIRAGSVIVAVPPKAAAALLGAGGGFRLQRWIHNSTPILATSLDIALRSLPRPDRTFAVGIDAPLYLSVHSRWAHLAPKPAALVHVAKYLSKVPDGQQDTDRRELEQLMDLVQPGWKQHVIHQRFLPRLTVIHALAGARDGGLEGRPAVNEPTIPNVYVAGDWVGQEGMLADAAFASARRAAQLIIGSRQRVLPALAV
jgi:phytoene dehydrogenase-like protein